MKMIVRAGVLIGVWLMTHLAALYESLIHSGVNAAEPSAPHQWDAHFDMPEPVLEPPDPQLPRVAQFVNNSMMVAQQIQEQANRDALFTMEVARKNLRNAALFCLVNQAAASTPSGALADT